MNIKTQRLSLVPVSKRHIQDIFDNFNSQVVTYMFPKTADNIEETCEVVERFISEMEDNTNYNYAITLKDNGEFLGLAGLNNLKEEIPELGIWTKISSHGNHYGREAIGGLIEYAKSLKVKKLCYPVDIRNIPSKKIPLFYGGRLTGACKELVAQDKRILQIETYEITL